MSKAKHTPGPWQAVQEKNVTLPSAYPWWRVYTDDGDDSELIAEVARTPGAKLHEVVRDEPNARLISAAPDGLALAEAVRGLISRRGEVNYRTSEHSLSDLRQMADAFLAKVIGPTAADRSTHPDRSGSQHPPRPRGGGRRAVPEVQRGDPPAGRPGGRGDRPALPGLQRAGVVPPGFPDPTRNVMSGDEMRAAAERIADRLFTSGVGHTADRLVLFMEDALGGKNRDLGGWSRKAVVEQVVSALSQDDERITAEWLRSIGSREPHDLDDAAPPTMTIPGYRYGVLVQHSEREWVWCRGPHVLATVCTRGHLRRLMAAIGAKPGN